MWFIKPGWVDVVDLVVVSYIFYRFLLLIKGTRAVQMLVGLTLILALSLLAHLGQLRALQWLIGVIEQVWVVVFVIVFQPEIRKALVEMGSSRFVRFFVRAEEDRVVSEIVAASRALSEKGVGALIAIEREIGLKTFIETGTRIEASVTAELINTIFTPKTPLHDGALVIKGDLIVAAGCILPLTQNQRFDRVLGTRHKAAVGLTEESDAVVVVVSEETRSISLAYQGQLYRGLDPEALKAELLRILRSRGATRAIREASE